MIQNQKYTLQAIIIFDFRLLTDTVSKWKLYTKHNNTSFFLKQWMLYYKAASISPYLTKPDYDYRMQSFKSSWGISSMYQYFVVFTTIFHVNCCLPTVLKNRASTESSFILLQNCSQWLYIPSDVPYDHISILVQCFTLSKHLLSTHLKSTFPSYTKQTIYPHTTSQWLLMSFNPECSFWFTAE